MWHIVYRSWALGAQSAHEHVNNEMHDHAIIVALNRPSFGRRRRNIKYENYKLNILKNVRQTRAHTPTPGHRLHAHFSFSRNPSNYLAFQRTPHSLGVVVFFSLHFISPIWSELIFIIVGRGDRRSHPPVASAIKWCIKRSTQTLQRPETSKSNKI